MSGVQVNLEAIGFVSSLNFISMVGLVVNVVGLAVCDIENIVEALVGVLVRLCRLQTDQECIGLQGVLSRRVWLLVDSVPTVLRLERLWLL